MTTLDDSLPVTRRLVLRGAGSVALAGLGVVALLGALALWFHYGTAVFFETITAGISACF